ncbi:prolyl oligopeptidase family serine peptidase [Chitinophaga sancti]|uniref:alpha/beta hydrolase family protein n=1 Tax=Chitinophaga sancti TaxID=1004 RepID=UPI002A75A4C4|nr:prolyl oligopeptidase family serine peptidase [Chitinophaga sancti]WPQ63342.1 prolyl oligopeptidase family serine peptidase [Chitinophaga sancti]
MKYCVIYFTLFFLSKFCYSQKPVIDEAILDSWTSVGSGAITNDGLYFSYIINNKNSEKSVLVVKGIKEKSEKRFVGVSSSKFTENSKQLLFTRHDSLYIISLKNFDSHVIPQIKYFNLINYDNTQCIFYNNSQDEFIIFQPLKKNIKYCFKGVIKYWLSKDGSQLALLINEDNPASDSKERLYIVKTKKNEFTKVWEGAGLNDVVFTSKNDYFLYVKGERNCIYSFEEGMKEPVLLIDDKSLDIFNLYTIIGIQEKHSSSQYLFVNLQDKDTIKPLIGSVMLDIYSYNDIKNQSVQLMELGPKRYLGVVDVKNKTIKLLNSNNESVNISGDNKWVLTRYIPGDIFEHHWNIYSQPICYLENILTGSKKRLNISREVDFSPGNRYLFGFDSTLSDIYSYNLNTEILTNITKKLPIPIIDSTYDYPTNKRGISVIGWFPQDSALLISDRFDIWLLDPVGKSDPICLTKHVGRNNNIFFKVIGIERVGQFLLDVKRPLILGAFNNETKENGFYSVRIKNLTSFRQLSMGKYTYESENIILGKYIFVKSSNNKSYLVLRGSTTESPNYYYTNDFNHFLKVSNISPEKNCNWLTSKLIIWTNYEGETLKGVLYFPENFDSTKTYPIIFHFYEKMSDELYKFQQPGYTHGLLNIPWFVSHGYLVFTPDINYKMGYPGKSSLSSIESAANYLSRYSWIDTSRMGLQGHSFSGFETNYIITHTKRFSAAVAGSGMSDFISDYNSLLGGGESRQEFAEVSQNRIGATLWERQDLYIENSPILKANQVCTPLLLMNNKKDGIVPFFQGMEMYLSLRRLNKKVWLLQYDNEGHHVLDEENSKDYTLRINQFFDFYLKDSLPPKWMKYGVPAKLKGIDLGVQKLKD